MKPNEITIGAAIDVHRAIGPGQDEVLYEDARDQEDTEGTALVLNLQAHG